MRTLRRYLFVQIAAASALVLLVFLGLVFFLDVINGLSSGGGAHSLAQVMVHVALEVPGRAYESMPIAVLTGTVYVLASLAASSEFTVMRMSGLSPRRALLDLVGLGLGVAALLFVIGEFVAPAAERLVATLQARDQGGSFGTELRSGVWLRDRTGANDDQMINVGRVAASGTLGDVRIYVIDAQAHLTREVVAASADARHGGYWTLHGVTDTTFPAAPGLPLQVRRADTLDWTTTVSPAMLEALLLDPSHMSLTDLWRYVQHLRANGQSAQRDEIALWRKTLYPFSAVVMMLLALPFAYLHARSGQISWKVFGGIMLGISFILTTVLSSRLGLVASWPTWLAAALPYLLYGGAGLGFFVWRVRYH